MSASRESPRKRATSTFAHDYATDSVPISKSLAESVEQADELPHRKIDDLSDATGIVHNDLSLKTAIPRSYRSCSCPMRLRSQSFFQSFLASFSTSVDHSLFPLIRAKLAHLGTFAGRIKRGIYKKRSLKWLFCPHYHAWPRDVKELAFITCITT
jgi:hypothetical protein